MIEKATGLYLIPAGTQRSACESCRQDIYWIEHTRKPKNRADHPGPRPLPISLKHVLAIAPTHTTYGRGISHFADCPNAARHKKHAPIARHSPGGPVHARMELVP